MLRKAGKENDDDPKSWRPIELLSPLGKIFEKVVADKMRDLAAARKLLPQHQYGTKGRSTTKAVQHLQNIVYRSWNFTSGGSHGIPGYKTASPRRIKRTVASLLGFDISGAYNRVPWDNLIDILISKMFGDALVIFCWSFL